MKKLLFFLIVLFAFETIHAQDIYPNKKGSELITLLKSNYSPTGVLSYNAARDQLWGAVAGHNQDTLHGVYTGLAVYISPSASNPRTVAYNQGIDCEHTWPQSLGASGDAKSDMHHLFPTRTNANSSRGNLPFGEVDDNQTDKWFYKTNIISSIPTSNINLYSELLENKKFEPREDHKGNVARAMFYFYTIYKDQSDQSFFTQQKDVLYQWHYMDPPDDEEIWRNNFINSKQGNKNPFIVDTTLIRRAYFPQYEIPNSIDEESGMEIRIFPNPCSDYFQVQNLDDEEFLFEIYNYQGQQMMSGGLNENFNLPVRDLPEGVYFLSLRNGVNRYIKKFVKI
jgi:hypothetical protein